MLDGTVVRKTTGMSSLCIQRSISSLSKSIANPSPSMPPTCGGTGAVDDGELCVARYAAMALGSNGFVDLLSKPLLLCCKSNSMSEMPRMDIVLVLLAVLSWTIDSETSWCLAARTHGIVLVLTENKLEEEKNLADASISQ